MSVMWGRRTPMRDGITLSADIYLPGDLERPVPAILLRTPYNKQRLSFRKQARFFADHGYAFMLQDVRGRHDSDGTWIPYLNEGNDGFDTIEWLASQAWCNGAVGTIGGSYSGWTQWCAAREQPAGLLAMMATASAGNWMMELPYHNGIPWLTMYAWLNQNSDRTVKDTADINWREVFFSLPLKDLDKVSGRSNPAWTSWLEHDTLDDFWMALRLDEAFAKINLPVLHVTGWFDVDQPGALYFYNGMRSKSPAQEHQKLIIGPWDHSGTRYPSRVLDGVDFGTSSVCNMDEEALRWFEVHLRGLMPLMKGRLSNYFITGANQWVSDACLYANQPYLDMFLAGSDANSVAGFGHLAFFPEDNQEAQYIYDPLDPVIAVDDFNIYGEGALTRLDRSDLDKRLDVLVFTSAPLEQDLLVLGFPEVKLFVSTSAKDTDWIVRVGEVSPDDSGLDLALGLQRARYIRSLSDPQCQEAGSLYHFTIMCSAVGHLFRKGYRVRLSIMSSLFPYYARNLNTGLRAAEEVTPVKAHNSVYFGHLKPSCLRLPVVDRKVTGL